MEAPGRTLGRPTDRPLCCVFAGDARKVRAARAFVARELADWPRADLDDIETCVSEIATNAIRHTRSGLQHANEFDENHGRFAVTVHKIDAVTARVEIADCGGPADAASPAYEEDDCGGEVEDEFSAGGLGLHLVAVVSRGCWGYRPADFGRVTWFLYRRGWGANS